MSSGLKLAVGGAAIVAVTVYMAYVGASASWQYYVTTDECLAKAAELAGSRVRVSGRISAGTLEMAADRSHARFSLQGNDGTLAVVCEGPLPDDLNEDREVVVEGLVESDGVLRGDKVLTRCASKYETGQAGTSSAEGSAQDTEGGS